MKKKILGSIAVLAIAAVAAFNVNFSAQDSDLSTISLANVEALAAEEYTVNEGGTRFTCFKTSGVCKDTSYATYKGKLVK